MDGLEFLATAPAQHVVVVDADSKDPGTATSFPPEVNWPLDKFSAMIDMTSTMLTPTAVSYARVFSTHFCNASQRRCGCTPLSVREHPFCACKPVVCLKRHVGVFVLNFGCRSPSLYQTKLVGHARTRSSHRASTPRTRNRSYARLPFVHCNASWPQALLRSIFASVRELSVSDNDVNVIVFAFKTGQLVYHVALHVHPL